MPDGDSYSPQCRRVTVNPVEERRTDCSTPNAFRVPFGLEIGAEPLLALPARGALGENAERLA